MTVKERLFVFGYREGNFVMDNGSSGKYYRVLALRQPEGSEKLPQGYSGILPFGKDKEGRGDYSVKIPASEREFFPSFSNLPGFYDFEFEIRGNELIAVAAENVANVVWPGDKNAPNPQPK